MSQAKTAAAAQPHEYPGRPDRQFLVINRTGTVYVEPSGRAYGELDNDQRQADAGYWSTNPNVRASCEPLTVAVNDEVQRIYEVHAWHPYGEKWVAELGRSLTNAELDQHWGDYPFRIGSYCPPSPNPPKAHYPKPY